MPCQSPCSSPRSSKQQATPATTNASRYAHACAATASSCGASSCGRRSCSPQRGQAPSGPRQGRGPITRRHKLISERHRELQSRQQGRRVHLTEADKGAWEDAASKNSGMQRAVRHLQTFLMQLQQPTLQRLQQNSHLPNKQQLYKHVEQQAEQLALEALDRATTRATPPASAPHTTPATRAAAGPATSTQADTSATTQPSTQPSLTTAATTGPNRVPLPACPARPTHTAGALRFLLHLAA
jgi:hypothetical protein